MAHVDLGVDNRNPGRSGQAKLLNIAMGEVDDFRMVEFDWYKENLERIQISLNSRNGAYAWVIGDRGTGKSEVLSYLFCKQIMMGTGKNPRLPLYISVSDLARRSEVPSGVPDGKVTIELINYLCSVALKQSFEFLRSYEGEPGLFKELRYHLRAADFYDTVMHYFHQEDFSLKEFLAVLGKSNRLKDLLKIAVYVDDMDKIKEVSAREFFSQAQTDLAELVSEQQVVFLSSVTKKFIREGREDEGLNYCLNRQHLGKESDSKELIVPDLSDLPAVDVQELINERLTYLHWGKPETKLSAPWVANFDKKPHNSHASVIEDERWESYDTTYMRRNGALLSLNAWLAARKQVSIRQVLRNLQAVLNDCDKPKKELTARILENKLKKNDTSDISSIRDEMKERLQVVETRRLQDEHELLSAIDKSEESDNIWNVLLYITLEKISLGEWGVPSGINQRIMGQIKRLTNQSFKTNSAVFQFLDLVAELGSEGEVLLPNIHARSPDDVFSIIDIKQLLKIIYEEISERKKAQFKIEYSEEVEHSSIEEENSFRGDIPGIVGEAYYRVIGKQYNTNDYSDPRMAEQLGKELAFELVRGIILTGEQSWSGKDNINHSIRNLHEHNWRQFRSSLLQWFTLRINRGEDDEDIVASALESVLFGREPFALMDVKFAEIFDNVVNREAPISFFEKYVERLVSEFNESRGEELGFKMESEISFSARPYCLKEKAEEVLNNPLKVSEKIQIRIDMQKDILDFRALEQCLWELDFLLRKIQDFKIVDIDTLSSWSGDNIEVDYSSILSIDADRDLFGLELFRYSDIEMRVLTPIHQGRHAGFNGFIFGSPDKTRAGGLMIWPRIANTGMGKWGTEGVLAHGWGCLSSFTINFKNVVEDGSINSLEIPHWELLFDPGDISFVGREL